MICLLRLGYVPLRLDDWGYVEEVEREKAMNFPLCLCSNCEIQVGKLLIENLKRLNQSNFSDYVLNLHSMMPGNPTACKAQKKALRVTNAQTKTQDHPMKLSNDETKVLKEMLIRNCHQFIKNLVPAGGMITARRFFGENEANAIARNLKKHGSVDNMEKVIGGELFLGQVEALIGWVEEFKRNHISGHPDSRLPIIEDRILIDITNVGGGPGSSNTVVPKRKRCT
jgi:hypothetical protein